MRQEFGRPVRTFDVPGFRLREALYNPAEEIAAHLHPWATLCLTVAGAYTEDWGVTRVRCDRASLVFHPPGDVYGDRISDLGSRCLTIGVDPTVFSSAAAAIPSLARLRASRRAPPSWLAFQLHQELELGDDLSPASVEGTDLALLAEVGQRPGAPDPRLHGASLVRDANDHLSDDAAGFHVGDRLGRSFERNDLVENRLDDTLFHQRS